MTQAGFSETFVSRHHPGSASRASAFVAAYARPLPLALLPLMITALAVVLQGGNVEPFLTVYFPVAFVGAAMWTAYVLNRRIVEVQVGEGGVCLRTAWEVVRDRNCRWRHVHGLRHGAPWITFAWGRTAIELNGTDWPRAPELLEALRGAAARYHGA